MELEHVVSDSSTGSIFHRGPQRPLVLRLEMDRPSPSRFQTVIGLGLVVDEATHVASSYARLSVVWHTSQEAQNKMDVNMTIAPRFFVSGFQHRVLYGLDFDIVACDTVVRNENPRYVRCTPHVTPQSNQWPRLALLHRYPKCSIR